MFSSVISSCIQENTLPRAITNQTDSNLGNCVIIDVKISPVSNDGVRMIASVSKCVTFLKQTGENCVVCSHQGLFAQ